MIRIRLATTDLNTLLAGLGDEDARVVYHDGSFDIQADLSPVQIRATAHLDVAPGRVRVALPFAEMRTRRTGGILGSVAGLIWPRWLEPWLERRIGDLLAAHGLPWDLVWLDSTTDEQRGRCGTVNLSAATLNRWLQERCALDGLAPRLAAIDIEPEGLAFGLDLSDGPRPSTDHSGSPPVSEPDESTIHIAPGAINTVLRHLLAGQEGLRVEFVDGRLQIEAEGLAISVYDVALGKTGLDVRLRVAPAVAGRGDDA